MPRDVRSCVKRRRRGASPTSLRPRVFSSGNPTWDGQRIRQMNRCKQNRQLVSRRGIRIGIPRVGRIAADSGRHNATINNNNTTTTTTTNNNNNTNDKQNNTTILIIAANCGGLLPPMLKTNKQRKTRNTYKKYEKQRQIT